MKNYHKNPRQITGKQASDLTESLDEFGDLGGIVHDLNSDETIGGNRRGDSFNINHCEIEITHRFDEPDEQGTVAHGFVVWRGKRYAYRQVRWTPRQCEQANVQANKLGGTFDFDILANEFDTPDLLDWGFSEWELGIPGGGVDLDKAWIGMPEYQKDGDNMPIQQIIVSFESAEDVISFGELLDQSVTEKTKSLWYPMKPWRDNLSLVMTDES